MAIEAYIEAGSFRRIESKLIQENVAIEAYIEAGSFRRIATVEQLCTCQSNAPPPPYRG